MTRPTYPRMIRSASLFSLVSSRSTIAVVAMMIAYAPRAHAQSPAETDFRAAIALFDQLRFQEAIPLFEKAASAGFQVNVAEFRMARAYSRLGSVDKGLEHLKRAADAGITLELLTSNPDIAPLRKDARYTGIFRRLEDSRFPCRNGVEAHQFDFWVGEWTVAPWTSDQVPAPPAGKSKVSAHLEHCMVLEEWTPTSGPSGKSFNFWDANRKKWRQVWTAEDGASLDYEGSFSDGAMRFSGWSLGGTGQRMEQKLTFFRVARDTVRQLFEASEDGGKTWKTTFDGRYVRARGVEARGP